MRGQAAGGYNGTLDHNFIKLLRLTRLKGLSQSRKGVLSSQFGAICYVMNYSEKMVLPRHFQY